MLGHLHIKNLAVLSETSVEFEPGLNVLTGETGAGKSIVVDSLALLAGARASADLIRTGADTLTVTGRFEGFDPACASVLEQAGLEPAADELVIRREVSRSGRNRVFVNDQPATLRLLAELMPGLLRIHGQREELGLVHPELQRAWVDRLGGDEGAALRETVARLHAQHRRLAERLATIDGDQRLRRERLELVAFQIAEIERAGLSPGEEEELARERDLLRNSEAIAQALGGLVTLVVDDEGSATERLAAAAAGLETIAGWRPEAEAWIAELAELRIRAAELARTARDEAERIEADPARLARVEDRLAVVERLCRKHGPSSRDVLTRLEALRAERADLDLGAEQRGDLERQVADALALYRESALELSRRRGEWAQVLSARVRRELAELALPQARLEIRLEHRPRDGSPLLVDGRAIDFGEHGIDLLTFDFSPNPGEELRPLAKVASGGELSRVYLALQLVGRDTEGAAPPLATPPAAPTLVFDEVDAGVGGVEAVVLGRKLRELARGGQILSVTHLPQVASLGDRHFKVEKRVRGGRTFVGVRRLEGPDRIDEVARMLGGEEAAAAARDHAAAMLAEADGSGRA
ncbi:MAG TPA: DNA repair protein RecN [Thermoanaerobaculia bacterium]|nr:DNA repair protein RecN [Thermoanaerobaculia bacterium]